MLGVLIGVASVIVLLAIGTGSSQSIEKSIESLGSNTLTVFSGSSSGSTTGTKIRNSTLNTASVTALSNSFNDPDVKSVSPVVTTSVTARTTGELLNVCHRIHRLVSFGRELYGVGGPVISRADVAERAPVIDIGTSVASALFATGADPLGKQIQLGSSEFTVVGLLASKGSSGLSNQDAVAIAPYTAVQDQLTGESASFSELLVQGKSSATLSLAESEVESTLRLSMTRPWRIFHSP